jgi:hypothetical protein
LVFRQLAGFIVAARGMGKGEIDGAMAGSVVVGTGLPANSPPWKHVEQPQLWQPHSEQPWPWPQ